MEEAKRLQTLVHGRFSYSSSYSRLALACMRMPTLFWLTPPRSWPAVLAHIRQRPGESFSLQCGASALS
eukprot:3864974-Amphidinium_carterae.1